MLENLLHQFETLNIAVKFLFVLLINALGTGVLYIFLFYIMRPIFRKLEQDIALVTLSVSSYPLLIVGAIYSLKFTVGKFVSADLLAALEHLLTPISIATISYWLVQLFVEVFIYYLKEYTKKTEAMWDDVLLPILSAVVPVIIYLVGGVLLLSSFGVDLSGIWVALGGATFVLGFALQDILSNFFSGVVLLIDTPFRFGDILLLEDGSIGMLRRIGIRVTQLYIFSNHCDVYIPNSVLQGQKLTNLSRPTSLYYHSLEIEIPSEGNFEESKKLMQAIVLAHPDTLGDIDAKLEVIDNYYNAEESDVNLWEQQEIGKLRLLAEQEVNLKLEEIEQALESLVVTVQFAEKGGLTQDERENVQQEYQAILELIGFQISEETEGRSAVVNFEEYNEEGLIELIREWYRIWLRDPNLLDEDQFFISDEWERKINLLKRRAQRLSQKISNPQADETRLDDYVIEIIKWLKEKLKVPRKKWQEPQIRMIGMNHEESSVYLELNISFFVDDIKLEDGKRGDRVRSQIYQEIFRCLQNTYMNWNGIKEIGETQENGNAVDASITQSPVSSFVQTGLDSTTAKQGFAFYLSVGRNKSGAKSGKALDK
ncbi:mechanosensitive ion channel [Kamptonema animale CS-326]|jgi:MscS family membrane protein|uniref:mechanosensitive ion channel family protein n=1 Tax=Kamptonema animale TaxID=92934 RepID=UPI00232AA12F|nr:mechanosensitive ion channel domain-containing protein [Kamptonema animale]MDB9514914.1 mechanosensitive ion channel [Kamptonema animale CS-326]